MPNCTPVVSKKNESDVIRDTTIIENGEPIKKKLKVDATLSKELDDEQHTVSGNGGDVEKDKQINNVASETNSDCEARNSENRVPTVDSISSVKDLEVVCSIRNRSHNYHLNPGPVPNICTEQDCILGIDEAGRGPVLGPMVYGVAFVPKSLEGDLKATGCDDSKALTEQKRERIFDDLCARVDKIGWEAFVISPTHISHQMLQRQKTSLNEISHLAAIQLVERALAGGAKVTEIYVDTVGPAEKYQAKLQGIFPAQTVVVRSKADSIYPVVGAASVVAKVIRDVALRTWDMMLGTSQGSDEPIQWGSGYPNDPVTKKFLTQTLNPVFGFDDVVRFSWSTAQKILEESSIKVDWEDEELQSKNKGNTKIKNFFSSVDLTVEERHRFLKDRQLTSVVEF